MGWLSSTFGGVGEFFEDTLTDFTTLGAIGKKLDPGAPAAPPANPATDPAAIAERDRKAREEQLRRLLGGRESTILTNPMGLAQDANIATKSLLGG